MDLPKGTLGGCEAAGIETELSNFYDYQITSCQNCNYECVQKFELEKGVNAECPIKDDVRSTWKKTCPETTRDSWKTARRRTKGFRGECSSTGFSPVVWDWGTYTINYSRSNQERGHYVLSSL